MEQQIRWGDIFENIGVQLHRRSGMLVRKVLWASAFGFAAVFVLSLMSQLLSFDVLYQSGMINISSLVYGLVILIVVIIITSILMTLVKIEQVVWLNSYFEGKDLTPKESRTIAVRLFGGWIQLQFRLFYRYYLWPLAAAVATVVSWLYIFAVSKWVRDPDAVAILSTVMFIGGLVGIVLWQRYLKLKLSFAPFLFLNIYKRNASPRFWSDFFKEMRRLNEVNKDDSFRKNVMLEIGGDIAVTIEQYVISRVKIGFSTGAAILPSVPGALASALSNTASMAAGEIAYRVIMFGKLAGRQVMYDFAMRKLHGVGREPNEYIYSLKD
ncbi:hypothetical protein HYV30_03910 [Candidatus Kaiserbacteria bacterium]|nr:hypothetical protein [Candidatus Kaiserbacteria bacterium]